MADAEDTRGFLRVVEYEAKSLREKIFKTDKKLNELRNLLHDKEELQAFLEEQVEELE